jgi:hypothetical protein
LKSHPTYGGSCARQDGLNTIFKYQNAFNWALATRMGYFFQDFSWPHEGGPKDKAITHPKDE